MDKKTLLLDHIIETNRNSRIVKQNLKPKYCVRGLFSRLLSFWRSSLQHFDRLNGWKGMFQCCTRANRSLCAEELYLLKQPESHWEDLGIISFQNWEKGVLVVSIFDLVLDGVYAVGSFLAKNMLGKWWLTRQVNNKQIKDILVIEECITLKTFYWWTR